MPLSCISWKVSIMNMLTFVAGTLSYEVKEHDGKQCAFADDTVHAAIPAATAQQKCHVNWN